MEEEMRQEGYLLWALESGDPVSDFDAVAFSLGYEMAYTNVLNMLDLASIPLKSADRPGLVPLVFAGGTSCCNPEPLADYIDLFAIGEGEDMGREVLELFRRAKKEGWSKKEFLRRAANIGACMPPPI